MSVEDEAGKEFKANLQSLLKEECFVDNKPRYDKYGGIQALQLLSDEVESYPAASMDKSIVKSRVIMITCHQLAELYQNFEKQEEKAFHQFKKTCLEMCYMPSCFALGMYYMQKREFTGGKDPDKALKYFLMACEANISGACNNAGLILQHGTEKSPKDVKRAEALFEKACKDDFANGCFNQSILYLTGREKEIPRDMEKAVELGVKSCNLGHLWGCMNASKAYKTGDGIEADQEKAKKFSDIALELMGAKK
ncbi:Cytochrome c oxidase assembly factor 7B [Trichoplax sp. H2]|nr:Cytochrome c oxidase assembly factor 7B [Trichoplax sp. H2]|eukprot:RDD47728.1 Cytochrome c oxidase assembly factor 7B [Trichoplax sp. H2]